MLQLLNRSIKALRPYSTDEYVILMTKASVLEMNVYQRMMRIGENRGFLNDEHVGDSGQLSKLKNS